VFDHIGSEPVTYVAPATLPGVEFIAAENCTRKWRYFHEHYIVCMLTKGSADWHYRGRTHSACDRCYVLMEPGETHVNLAIPRPQTYTVLQISPAKIEQLAAEIGVPHNPHFALAQASSPAIIRAFELLVATVANSDTALEQQSHFALLMRLVLGNCIERAIPCNDREPTAHCAPIERAKMYLRERFNEPVTLDELSTAVGLSRFHLLRSFTKRVGIPPHAYQIRVRIERARRLLRAGVPLAVASTDVGFADQSHFTRHFKKVMYSTPGGYARSDT
jgi:AraC-like DNA-binding protein